MKFEKVRGRTHVAFDRSVPLCSPLSTYNRMLITKTYHDVPSPLDNGKPIRIFIIAPTVPGYPQAKFPGDNNLPTSRLSLKSLTITYLGLQGVVCFSEIYQVTGPVERFAGQIASHGYVVGGSGHRYPLSQRVECDLIDLGQRVHPPITSLRVRRQFLMTPKVFVACPSRNPNPNCSQGRTEGIITRYPLSTDPILLGRTDTIRLTKIEKTIAAYDEVIASHVCISTHSLRVSRRTPHWP